ncbi:IS1182 family transposase [Streptomyces sp. NBC_00572]|uniref:IS1182 family transposase n=1 Tax=Streptomyces sp. NBC_00572 TaxID=2903664 RepID=UPI00224D76A1|nr:IS1182 family transposase [Streptomyces sp. NBC_00572]MCX4986932.1 IS1182 family transposase [Streptomyces sp. NBC_00572]
MSLRVEEPGEIPAGTVRVARRAFPGGSLAIRVRDELGVLFRDEDFAMAFPRRGKPAWSPGRLALVVVLQFVEGLTDRQAAEAVRARIDWKYDLGLELEDPGFDYSVLSEFRDRLVACDAGRGLLDAVLAAAQDRGLLKSGRRARTDSTHAQSAARDLSWPELVGETLRSALNAAAATAPSWLGSVALPEWFEHYGTPLQESRFPKSRTKRAEVGERIGADGMLLLQAAWSDQAPLEVRSLEAVELLRRVWVQHFEVVEEAVRRRGPKDIPPGAMRIVTPHDPQARGSVKRDIVWNGYKVHFTETCEPDAPNLLTQVITTVAPVPDNRMAKVIHARLAETGRLPAEHWVDAGYVSAGALAAARRDHGVDLHGPLAGNTTAQASGAYGQDAFTIDWENKQVTCPNGVTSTQWRNGQSQEGLSVIRVRFSPADCRVCPVLRNCVSSPKAERREISLRHRDEYEAAREARARQQTDEWKKRYQVRAGIEGTFSQGVLAFGLRRSRYRGVAKTSLQHQLTGAAINLTRIDAWLTSTPRARTRTSHLAALRPAG